MVVWDRLLFIYKYLWYYINNYIMISLEIIEKAVIS